MLQKIQRFGGAMFAPAMLFSISGLMVGVSALATTVDIVGDLAVYGTPWYVFWTIIQRGSWTVFKRLPAPFCRSAAHRSCPKATGTLLLRGARGLFCLLLLFERDH